MIKPQEANSQSPNPQQIRSSFAFCHKGEGDLKDGVCACERDPPMNAMAFEVFVFNPLSEKLNEMAGVGWGTDNNKSKSQHG